MEFLVGLQQWIRAAVGDQLAGFGASHDVALLTAMVPLGIAFGAIHALTPGHGKTILASYVAGSGHGLARSIGVATLLAATHVVSAVVLALAGAPLLARTLAGAGRADAIEAASRGLIAVIGLWLLLRAIRGSRHLHGEGPAVAVAAGLVPCPLTLFAMVYAISRGIPEAGLVFAAAMLVGIGITLAAVATLTVLARDRVVAFLARHDASVTLAARWLDGIAGFLLILLGVAAFL